VALKHDELKEMGIASVGHRLTILKNVYEIKVNQDIPIESDHYLPHCKTAIPTTATKRLIFPLAAEQDPLHEFATKVDVQKLAKAIIQLRDERVEQAESELRKLADDYRRLRQELLPVFKLAKERSEPLPYAPHQASTTSTDLYQHDVASPTITQTFPEKTSLTRTFSKKLFSSTPKNNSPTHLPTTIHEGKTLTDTSSLDPSAAATAASNHLTASMSGGIMPMTSSSNNQASSPTSPLHYHQPLAPRSYARDGGATSSMSRYDGGDETTSARANPISTPPITRDHDPPNSASSLKSSISSKANPTNSTFSTASTAVPSAHNSLNSSSNSGATTLAPSSTPIAPTSTDGAPSVEIFKSFRVGLDDPCYKVLPAALRKYNIHADWRQYALYIVYGDQERAVGMEEKPLALFKELDREGKKPMFMLRKVTGGAGDAASAGIGLKPPGLGGGGPMSSAASVRTTGGQGVSLPGGVL
jgi:protein STE50